LFAVHDVSLTVRSCNERKPHYERGLIGQLQRMQRKEWLKTNHYGLDVQGCICDTMIYSKGNNKGIWSKTKK